MRREDYERHTPPKGIPQNEDVEFIVAELHGVHSGEHSTDKHSMVVIHMTVPDVEPLVGLEFHDKEELDWFINILVAARNHTWPGR